MKLKLISVLIIIIFFLLLRLLPYLNNPVPFGYDAGIYLYLFKILPVIPEWLKLEFSPGLFIFIYPLIKMGINPENILIPLSIISQVFLFLMLYLVMAKLTDKKTALITCFIFLVSSIQFRNFWFFYIKNTFALGFLLLNLYFLQQKSLVMSIFLGTITGFFHLPTFLILFIILLIHCTFDGKNRIFYLKSLSGIILIAGIYYLPHYKIVIEPFINPIIASTLPVKIATGTNTSSGGTFYDLPDSLVLTILYLPFAVYGFYLSIVKNYTLAAKNYFTPFRTAFLVCLLIVFTGFFFSRRYFITFDLFLIIFAGIGFSNLLKKYSKNEKISDLLKFYPVILIIFIVGFIYKTAYPLIDKTTFSEIKSFPYDHKNDYILSTDKSDTAWLLGYTDSKIIAWGYGGEDKYWSHKEWEQFFLPRSSNDSKIKLLNKLPQPLYIYINDNTKLHLNDLIKNKSIKPISKHFFSFKKK